MQNICLRKEACTCEKGLLLVSKQITYTRVQSRWILSFSFQNWKNNQLYGIQGTYQSEQANPKCAFTQAKGFTQNKLHSHSHQMSKFILFFPRCFHLLRVKIHFFHDIACFMVYFSFLVGVMLSHNLVSTSANNLLVYMLHNVSLNID